jgi:hypothetical protein
MRTDTPVPMGEESLLLAKWVPEAPKPPPGVLVFIGSFQSGLNGLLVQEGYRDRRAQSKHNDHQQSEDQLLSEIFHFPCISQCLEHLRSPRPFPREPRFFLLHLH